MEGRKIKIWSMTRDQSLVAAAVFVSFFVLWFLWAAAGQSVICWIEDHPGLASWVQAIGSIVAIFIAIFISLYERRQINEAEENKKHELAVFAKNYLVRHLKNNLPIIRLVYEACLDFKEYSEEIKRKYVLQISHDINRISIPDADFFIKSAGLGSDIADRLSKPFDNLQILQHALAMHISARSTIFVENIKPVSGNEDGINEFYQYVERKTEEIFVAFQIAIIFFEED